ncbi:MAG: aminopeptidase N [Thiomonas sp.]
MTAKPDTPARITRLADYTPPPYAIDSVQLRFDLDPAKTRVHSRMAVRRVEGVAETAPLVLDGEDITLLSLKVDGEFVAFRQEGNTLLLDKLPAAFTLEIETLTVPQDNTQLTGLYMSGGAFFTQCEAEGFRRITYWPDRPDVMSRFHVTLRADKAKYPVLLSNGNLVSQTDLGDGRHEAVWDDPFPKPCYLFALVGGNLVCREQTVRAASNKTHLLQVYVRAGDLDKTEHAMQSLIKAIAWDEQRFGLSLDLDRFMIVAVSDFNMGAMENKGLNIFNTKYVLAKPATATDADYDGIESVVGHEYFHNWTGNRVTCRDWFQLSLKEGLTVFRDQEFSQDLAAAAGGESARAVKRIEDVRMLRTVQFSEDAGPMAHPVRPEQYQAIDNFYTATVYEKGAEVVRMMQTLVGRAGFRAGLNLYFERFDGQAVTCDDFAQAIADANPDSPLAQHLEAFKRWYSQAGTPRVHASGSLDVSAGTYTLTLRQTLPDTPGQTGKQPQVIPVRMGLLGPDGAALPLWLDGQDKGTDTVLVLLEREQTFTFERIAVPAVTPSLLRGFSAPVILEYAYTDADLLHLLAHDSDPFNRWEAAQRLALARLLDALRGAEPSAPRLDAAYIDALRAVLQDPALDPAFKELALTLPGEAYIAEQLDIVDPPRIHRTRQALRRALAQQLAAEWQAVHDALAPSAGYSPDFASSGRRALRNLAQSYLCELGQPQWLGRVYQKVKDADNMTDRFAALSALVQVGAELAAPALERFAAQFAHEPLVMDKWFALQASAPDHDGRQLDRVRALMRHPAFSLHNPNRARSVLFAYCQGNPGAFHRADGAGYAFWAEQVQALDAINPQVAARLARALDRWRKLAPAFRDAAQHALHTVAQNPRLSADTREIVERALAD